MGIRGGEWKQQLLEEHFHEVAGTSYTDAQSSGFEVLPDDMVIKTFLTDGSSSDPFEVTSFTVSLLATGSDTGSNTGRDDTVLTRVSCECQRKD